MLTLEGCYGGPPGVELRPACVLGVAPSGRKAPGDVPDPVAGVKAVLSPAQKAENPCLRGCKGGIQAPGRGWAPSIWEMSDKKDPEHDPSHVDPDHKPGHEDDSPPVARPGTHVGDPGASGGGDSGGSGTSTWTSGQKKPPTASGGGSVVIGTRPHDYVPPAAAPPAAPATTADALEAAAVEAAGRYKQHGSSSIAVVAPEAGTSLADLMHSAPDPSDPGRVAPARVALEQHLRAWDEGKADILERQGVKGLETQAQSLTYDVIRQTDSVQTQATDGDITGYATNALEVVMGLSGDLKLAAGNDTQVVAGVWKLEAAGRGARTSDVADARSHKLSQWVADPLAGKAVPAELTGAMKTLGKTLDGLDPTRPAGKVGKQLRNIADAVAAAQAVRERCRQDGTLDFDTVRGLGERLTATAALLGRTIRGRFLS